VPDGQCDWWLSQFGLQVSSPAFQV